MKNRDLLKCTLPKAANLDGSADPIGLANDDNLLERVEILVEDLPRRSDELKKQVPARDDSLLETDFQKKVHSWDTKVSLWRRSAKE